MEARASRGNAEYQRITDAEGREDEQDGDLQNGIRAGENGRTILPQANPHYSNEWDER